MQAEIEQLQQKLAAMQDREREANTTEEQEEVEESENSTETSQAQESTKEQDSVSDVAQQQQQMDDAEEHDSTPTDPDTTEANREKRDLVKWSVARSKYNCADGAKIELRRKTFTRYAEEDEDGQPG